MMKNVNRMSGWLYILLAYLLASLLASSLILVIFVNALLFEGHSQVLTNNFLLSIELNLSLIITLVVWLFTLWVIYLFYRCSQRFPTHCILWLLLMVLLALKSFAFSPIADSLAVQNMCLSLLGAAVFVPYIKRSRRVQDIFIE